MTTLWQRSLAKIDVAIVAYEAIAVYKATKIGLPFLVALNQPHILQEYSNLCKEHSLRVKKI